MRAKIIFRSMGILSLLPFGLTRFLGLVLGLGFSLIPNRERQQARVNVALCFPELDSSAQRRLVRQSLVENAKTLLEMPGIWLGDPDAWLTRIHPGDGSDLPQLALAKGRGVIMAAPHLGAWEAGLHYLTQLAPITVLYRPPREAGLEQLIVHGRSTSGARLVPTNNSGVKALYQALNNNEMVAILPDQQPRHAGKGAGVFAPFFGISALTMVLVNRLARKTGAQVVYSYLERLPRTDGYRVHFLPAPDGIDAPDAETAASALNLGVERCVRRCPSQYQWSYRRFSVRPDGGRSPYKQSPQQALETISGAKSL